MASSRWIVNASPLILLGKVEQIQLLGPLAKAAGLIDRAGPVVQRLRQTGLYASDDIAQRLLREVGESPVQDQACRK
jgi:hypothetical protein